MQHIERVTPSPLLRIMFLYDIRLVASTTLHKTGQGGGAEHGLAGDCGYQNGVKHESKQGDGSHRDTIQFSIHNCIADSQHVCNNMCIAVLSRVDIYVQ